ncbi:MAG: bacteriohopanetetrol glucosamine biosynthesis glycosyltransferase HpnI [Acidobacteriaceae bacterium]
MLARTIAEIVEFVTSLLALVGCGYSLFALWAARSFLKPEPPLRADFCPPVTILKPVKGLDPAMDEAFASHCRQDYAGEYEILFGVSSLDDPAVAAIERLQAAFPERDIRIVLCPEKLGPNGKLSNLVQMLPHAKYDHFVLNDSDIAVGRKYLARMMAPMADARVGLVTAPYRGRSEASFGSRLEALGISTDFFPGVLVARYVEKGIRFGLGSTLAFSRLALVSAGGFAPLVTQLADDYELGARIAKAGFRVHLSHEVVETSVPKYKFADFAAHQLRWARTVRASRPGGYFGLMVTYGLAWATLNLIASAGNPVSLALFSLVFLTRMGMALGIGVGILGDRQVMRYLWMLWPRDVIALGLWMWAYASDTVVWRGERFRLRKGELVKE